MAINDNCKDRLRNWKFGTAQRHLEPSDESSEAELVRRLADMFDNSGWFGGQMGELVGACVDLLAPDEESDE